MKRVIIFLSYVFIPFLLIAQNVGIGTTNPDRPLHIVSDNEALRIQGASPWIGFMNYTDPTYAGFLYYTGTSLVMGSRSGTNLPLTLAPNNNGLLFATAAQRIGIGNGNPSEKLDVSGNVNVTGTIKANGVDGTSGQVLMNNGNGTMQWGDMCEFKNYVIYNYTSAGALQPFSVPAGVTKIKIQAWGGGGYGTHIFLSGVEYSGAGGGGGGYITGYSDVTVSTVVNVVVGGGGVVASGGNSRVEIGSPATKIFTANGGSVSTYNGAATRFDIGAGGSFSATGTTNYYGMPGESGYPTTSVYEQRSSTEFVIKKYFGNGGNAGNTNSTGGRGGFDAYITSPYTLLNRTNGTAGAVPGGGGASIGPAGGGANGGNGMVIIYY